MTPFLPDILENMISFDWEIDYHEPAFDEQRAAEEPQKEAARVLPVHSDPTRALVPEVRGQTLRRAREMLATVGLEIEEDIQWIQGSVWAPDRIMLCSPDPGTDVARTSKVKLGVTGDWLCGPEPSPERAPW